MMNSLEVKEITYLSHEDHSMQPAFVCAATGNEKRPLVVCLHTWSYGLEAKYEHYWILKQ